MFSCLGLERLAPLDMMDELRVHGDKSWTDGSETHQSQRSVRRLHAGTRETSSGLQVNCSTLQPVAGKNAQLLSMSSRGARYIYTSSY